MDTPTSDPRYIKARRRVRAIRGFYIHALVFVCVNLGLFLLGTLHPGIHRGMSLGLGTLGWGIGLAAHALSVFAGGTFLGDEWEARKIREQLERKP